VIVEAWKMKFPSMDKEFVGWKVLFKGKPSYALISPCVAPDEYANTLAEELEKMARFLRETSPGKQYETPPSVRCVECGTYLRFSYPVNVCPVCGAKIDRPKDAETHSRE
jgi:DNA-directed RNA polymerase subunit RPC12/RpoP